MKKHGAVMWILILTLIPIWGATFSAYGQEKVKPVDVSKETDPFTIKRLVIGTGVEESEPVGVAETFPVSTEKVYCFLEAADITNDMEVSFVWFHDQKEMLTFDLPIKMGPRWRTYAFKNLRGLKGDWKVEIRSPEGKVLKDVKFKVE